MLRRATWEGARALNAESSAIVGYAFSVEGQPTGGMLNLRVALKNAPLVDLARALGKLEGVRVTVGPTIVSRGDCYVVHCPGFKLVLSATAPGSDFAQALLSRAIEPVLTISCELTQLFERLMKAPPRPAHAAERQSVTADRAPRADWMGTSTLRRTALQPGKTLARKTPLTRKTPLGRGKKPRP
jgi:hypothetical protein